MKMRFSFQHLTFYLFPVFLFFLLPCSIVATPVGICYGRVANNLPPPSAVVNILKSNGITNVRIFDANATTLQSFSGTGISLIIGIPNEDLASLASGALAYSLDWLQSNIFSHIPAEQVKYIAVGNEVFLKDPFYTPYVVPAITNLYKALKVLNLADSIKLSSPQAASILSTSHPPSSGTFDPSTLSVMIPLLQFLSDSTSPFMLNVYPYFSYTNNLEYVPLDYALFRSQNSVRDDKLSYNNLLEASIDAFVSAIEKEGFAGVKVVVTETGWPTAGGEAAGLANALTYNENVVTRVVSNFGTPKRPGEELEVYLFAAFDENEKGGEEYEKHFGIFRLDGAKAYDLGFS